MSNGDVETKVGILFTAKDEASNKIKDLMGNLTSLKGGFGMLAIGAAAAFAAVSAEVVASVKAAAESEEQLARADAIINGFSQTTLATMGGSVDEAKEKVRQFGAEMQRLGGTSDEAIAEGLTKLTQVTRNYGEAQKAARVALDLSIYKQMDYASSVDLMTKVLAGKVAILQRYGFQVDETTTKEQALAMIASRTAGQYEAYGQTVAGQMTIIKSQIDDIQENIGQAFLPTVKMLMEEILGVTDSINGDKDAMKGWAENIYRVTNFMIGMGKAAGLIFDAIGGTVVALGDTIYTALSAPFKSLAKAIGGDFKGAWEEIKNGSTQPAQTFKQDMGDMMKKVSADFDGIGKSAVKAIDLEGFQPIARSAKKTGAAITDMAMGGGKDAKELADNIKKLKETYSDFGSTTDQTLFDLKQAHEDTMKSISDSIDAVNGKIKDLNKSYAETAQGDLKGVAGAVVENEKRIAEIKKQMSGDIKLDEYRSLQDELAQRTLAISQNADFIKSINDAVVEARRVAGLSDLQRAIEEYNTKRAVALKDYNDKMADYAKEMAALKKKQADEQKLYQDKAVFLMTLQLQNLQNQMALAKGAVQVTKDQVEKEIAYYKLLADAISNARSGNGAGVSRAQAMVRSVNDAVISPAGDIITTHPRDFLIATQDPKGLAGGTSITLNVTVNGSGNIDRAAVLEFGNQIVKELKTQYKY